MRSALRNEDLTPKLRAFGVAVVYVLVAFTHATASASIYEGIMQMTGGSRVLTLANVREEGRLGAFFPLLPPSALGVFVSPWTWLAFTPIMAAHVALLWRSRLGHRSMLLAIILAGCVTVVIGYSLTVELRCGQRL